MSGLGLGPALLGARSRPTRRRCGTMSSNFKTPSVGATKQQVILVRPNSRSSVTSMRGSTKSTRPWIKRRSLIRTRPKRSTLSSTASTTKTLRRSVTRPSFWISKDKRLLRRRTNRAIPVRMNRAAKIRPNRILWVFLVDLAQAAKVLPSCRSQFLLSPAPYQGRSAVDRVQEAEVLFSSRSLDRLGPAFQQQVSADLMQGARGRRTSQRLP